MTTRRHHRSDLEHELRLEDRSVAFARDPWAGHRLVGHTPSTGAPTAPSTQYPRFREAYARDEVGHRPLFVRCDALGETDSFVLWEGYASPSPAPSLAPCHPKRRRAAFGWHGARLNGFFLEAVVFPPSSLGSPAEAGVDYDAVCAAHPRGHALAVTQPILRWLRFPPKRRPHWTFSCRTRSSKVSRRVRGRSRRRRLRSRRHRCRGICVFLGRHESI